MDNQSAVLSVHAILRPDAGPRRARGRLGAPRRARSLPRPLGLMSGLMSVLVLGLAPVAGALAAASGAVDEAAAAANGERPADPETAVIDLSSPGDLDGLIEDLAVERVVFIGETHDRYEDHLNQLAIIRGLHQRSERLAIGMELFQQPFQPQLDAYVEGRLDEETLLRETEYFERWRFDYRLYRPILRYAREHGIPLIALNIRREITDKVGDGGLAALSPEEAAEIPQEIDRGDSDYEAHLRSIFAMHPQGKDADFEHFLEVQLLWDEGMAERAAEWLEANPEGTLVVLAGNGHLEHGRGIPNRLQRRLPVPSAIVLGGRDRPLAPGMADYLLYPQPVSLPETGLLGVMLDIDAPGDGVAVQGFAPNSGAKEAGVEEGDRIVGLAGETIASYADIRIALMDSRPGQQLPVEVMRDPLVGGPRRLTFEVELQ